MTEERPIELTERPDPLPPAFFPVSLNLEGRRVVLIGDDREAIEKEVMLRESGADLVWYRDYTTVRDEDIIDAFFVLSTPMVEDLAKHLRALADEHRFLLCCIDQPRYGFVAMQAIVSSGPARVTISTGGVAPRVGKVFKEALSQIMDAKFARFLNCLRAQRTRNRSKLTTSEGRRGAMIAAAEGFALEVRVHYPQWFEDELAAMRPQVER